MSDDRFSWPVSMTVEQQRDALWSALSALVHGGEFAAWLNGEEREMSFAAAKELDEAESLIAHLTDVK